jgi:hypothetical protein
MRLPPSALRSEHQKDPTTRATDNIEPNARHQARRESRRRGERALERAGHRIARNQSRLGRLGAALRATLPALELETIIQLATTLTDQQCLAGVEEHSHEARRDPTKTRSVWVCDPRVSTVAIELTGGLLPHRD